MKKLFFYLCLTLLIYPSFAQNPVAENGRLQVIGHQLCNEKGKPLQLRGMSMVGIMHMPECLTWNSFKVLKADWNSNVVRVPVLMANYSNPNNYNQNPNDSQHNKSDLFFKLMSTKYAGKKNVIANLLDWEGLTCKPVRCS